MRKLTLDEKITLKGIVRTKAPYWHLSNVGTKFFVDNWYRLFGRSVADWWRPHYNRRHTNYRKVVA